MVSSGESWLFKGLQTDPVLGIDSKSIPQRLAAYGSNDQSRSRKPRLSLYVLVDNIKSDTTICLLLAFSLTSAAFKIFFDEEHRSTGSRG